MVTVIGRGRIPKCHYQMEGEQPKIACARVASLNEPHEDLVGFYMQGRKSLFPFLGGGFKQ